MSSSKIITNGAKTLNHASELADNYAIGQGKLGKLGTGLAAFSAFGEVSSRLKDGESIPSALIKGAGSFMLADIKANMYGPLGMPLALASMSGAVIDYNIERGKKKVDRAGSVVSTAGNGGSKTQIHTKNAQTMRNRGMSMMNDNGEMVRSAFGSEARAFYREAY